MHLIILGLNHTTAPLDVRERLFIAEERQGDLLDALKRRGASEAAVISTCNRTEIYMTGVDPRDAQGVIADVLTGYFAADTAWIDRYTYTLADDEAYKHLFLVASGLDSMVVGEPQILGQVKDAYRCARRYNASGPFFDKVFHRAFQVAKRVRTETRIGYNPVSISGMAVELARKIFGDLGKKQILVLGAGEMCEVALKHFRKEGLEDILVVNRTLGKAQHLADDIIGTPCPFEDIPALLLRVDMVLSSTGSEKPIIDKEMVLYAMKKRKSRPLFFIDIAVPRDIDPAVNDIDNAYLYDIDDLKDLSQQHLSNRLQEAQKAHAIVDEEVRKFGAWLKQLERNPLITAIRENVEAIRTREVKKAIQRMKQRDPETIEQVDLLTRAIVGKLLHPHIMMIKKNGSPAVLEIIRDLLLAKEDDETSMDSGDEGE
jgi:glutamyl-tRNA reductase